jgi:hypothetical protein
MTEEQWALFESYALHIENRGDFANATERAFLAAYRELKSRRDSDRWIPVEERLPEEKGDFVLAFANGAVRTMWYSRGEWSFPDFPQPASSGLQIEDITHWRPLPDPPEKTKEGE